MKVGRSDLDDVTFPTRGKIHVCRRRHQGITHTLELQPRLETKVAKGLASGTDLLLARGKLTVAADQGSLS